MSCSDWGDEFTESSRLSRDCRADVHEDTRMNTVMHVATLAHNHHWGKVGEKNPFLSTAHPRINSLSVPDALTHCEHHRLESLAQNARRAHIGRAHLRP